MKNKPKELMDDVKSRCSNRYTCVNIQNYNTLKFRIFRGTLKYNTFIATLQLIDDICDVALSVNRKKVMSVAKRATLFLQCDQPGGEADFLTMLKSSDLSDEQMPNLSWSEFVSNLDIEKRAELITYLKERNLYINELVESEEDA